MKKRCRDPRVRCPRSRALFLDEPSAGLESLMAADLDELNLRALEDARYSRSSS